MPNKNDYSTWKKGRFLIIWNRNIDNRGKGFQIIKAPTCICKPGPFGLYMEWHRVMPRWNKRVASVMTKTKYLLHVNLLLLAVTGGQCSKHCVLGIVHSIYLPYLCTRLICINYKGKLSYGTIKNVFHQLCLSARTDGTRDAEVYESLSCTADQLGTETGQYSGWLDNAWRPIRRRNWRRCSTMQVSSRLRFTAWSHRMQLSSAWKHKSTIRVRSRYSSSSSSILQICRVSLTFGRACSRSDDSEQAPIFTRLIAAFLVLLYVTCITISICH